MTNPAALQNSPLIIISRAPYDGSLARGALDAAMSFAVFGRQPKLLFSGAGALCLANRNPTSTLGRKSVRKVVDSLPLYDVDEVFVEASALASFNISSDEMPEFATVLDSAAIKLLQVDRLIVSF